MCFECSHGGHQECYRAYYFSRPLVSLDGSSTVNSRTNTILESETRSGAPSVASFGTDPEKSDDASSIKTEKTADTLVTDPSNRNSLELPAQESKSSADWSPRGHPCAAGCGHFCWASNDRGIPEVQQM
ncbi:SEA (Seh1-associated) complex subunit [Ceratobasidium sp. 428]|nr:SEA (Seh1-associated) complex subunit [Ceratobasidium sp. 428]